MQYKYTQKPRAMQANLFDLHCRGAAEYAPKLSFNRILYRSTGFAIRLFYDIPADCKTAGTKKSAAKTPKFFCHLDKKCYFCRPN